MYSAFYPEKRFTFGADNGVKLKRESGAKPEQSPLL